MPQRSKRESLSKHRQNETWLWEQALAVSRSPIVITDPNEPDNPIVYANPTFERITGYSIEETIGKNCRFLQGEDRDQPALAELRAAIREGRECQVVLRNYKKDGTLFWNELSISSMHDEEGNLANFVGVLGDVTERKRTEEALKRQARQAALRTDVAAALSSGDTLSGVLQRCAEAMVRHLDATFARVWILDEEEDVLELQASAGMYTHLDGPHSRVPVGELKIGLIAQERLPHLTNTVTSDPRVSDKEWAKREGMVAFAGYPLIVEDRLVGVLAMFARQVLAEDTIDALESVATTVAQGIERKQTEEELTESEERFRGTFEQATVGMAHVGTNGHWLRVNQRLCEIVGYEKEELLELTFQDITHPDDLEVDLEYVRRLLAGEIETYSMEKRYFKKDGSVVWIYLTVSLVRSPSGEHRYFISVIEDITERKRVEEAQHFLAEAGTSLSSSLDYRATLDKVARLVVPYLADWCAIDILEEDGSLDRLALTHQDPEKVALVQELEQRYPPDPEAQRGVPQVLRTAQPELVPEIPESLLDETARDAEHREILRELGLKSYMIVPLVARGRTLGSITLVSAESGWRYGPTDLRLAEELARRAALAVDNARLYQARSEVVRTLQKGLLPFRLPEVPGIEVGLRYLSAGEVDVGGDFYDLFEVGTNGEADPSEYSSWGVAIGDVSGKGAEAATMLAFARYTIRAAAMHETRPSAILADLNETMLSQRRERGDHKFCTVAYARLETGESNAERGVRITVSRGGHPAPVLLGADGSISKIGPSGRAIGVFDDANLTEQGANLAPGDALVLYTDGVPEARSPDGLFFGEERLMSLLRSSVALDASIIAGRIEDAVLNFQEQVPRDDIAILVLRVSD